MLRNGSVLIGLILIVLGIILRWDLIDWLIDTTGILLIIIGVALLVFGIISNLTGSRRGSSAGDW